MIEHENHGKLGISPANLYTMKRKEEKQEKQRLDVFHRLFEEQAAQTPESKSVVCGNVSLTYEELNHNANILAKALVITGIGRGEVTALLCDRSINFLISMIGIFKAGAAYLPLDPLHPTQRQLQILHHSRVKFVMISGEFLDQMEEYLRSTPVQDRPVFLHIEKLLEMTGDPEFNLPQLSTPSDLAYVIYTSGSTGKPKGAMIEQAGMVNHLHAKIRDLEMTANDRIIQNASQCFDISVWQYLSCLLTGGGVYIVEDEISHDPSRLLSFTENNRITLLEVVPSILQSMLECIENDMMMKPSLESLRCLVMTGEALRPQLVKRWFKHYSGIPLLNAYGPTECSDDVTHYFIYEPPTGDIINMPIGKPIINTRVYVVKEDGDNFALCPVGEAGELWVAGICVGRGYLNDDDLSHKTFLDGNFFPIPEFRIYRTGDLVRSLSDGNIEFLGRIDRQVKVQGFRVELEEIESLLLKYPGVKDCVVKVVESNGPRINLVARQPVVNLNEANQEESHKRLIAYFIPEDSHLQRTIELRDYLSRHLPYYMVPAQFVRMKHFPLNANGKIDYNNLPAPDNVRPELEVEYLAPRNDLETALVSVWGEVLRIYDIGVRDNFFEIGGDSLLAMKIINRLSTVLQVEVSYKTFNEKQSIEELAHHIQLEKGGGENHISPLIPYPPRPRYPLTYAQKRIWFVCQMQPGNPFYNFAGILYIKGKYNAEVFRRAWEEILRRHILLNTRFCNDGGIPYQIFDHNEMLEIPVTDLKILALHERNQRLIELATAESKVPFDLETERLIRFRMYLLSDNEYALLLVMHEIILDGWGTCVMLNEFGRLYDGGVSGIEPRLPDVKVQYKDLAIWEDTYFDKQLWQDHKVYWSRELSGELPILVLPFDYPRPPKLDYKGDSVGLLLNEGLSGEIKKLAENNNVTLFTVLSAAFKVLLHYYSNQDDIIVGSPIVNRNSKETENMVGFQINMIAFRTDLSGEPTFFEFLEREREVIIGAISHAEYPFIELLDLINPVRDTTVSPIFQVMFNMLNFPYNSGNYENLELYFREIETQYTKYDISFYAQEQGEQIYLQFSYMTALFKRSTIERMMKNFETVINSIVNNPGLKISQFDFLSGIEKDILLGSFNSCETVPLVDSNMIAIFNSQVEKNPDSVAYIFKDQFVTLGLLDNKSSGVAAYLKSIGCKVQEFIALYIRKSLEMMSIILGVLKAGAAYVPLDVSYPIGMLRHILDDVNVRFMVLGAPCEDFPGFSKTRIYLGELEQSISNGIVNRFSDWDWGNAIGVFNILYTSSSTGKPKGVIIPQRAVLNRLAWMWNEYPFRPGDVLLFHKSFALVGASWELLGGLLGGISTLIITREDQQDVQILCRLIQMHRVTYFHASPPQIRLLQEYIEENKIALDSLRVSTTSAEPISPQLANKWNGCVPNAPLINLYGLTECSSNISEYCTSKMVENSRDVPLGKPLDNVGIMILNSYMKLSPIGVNGEICVWGHSVAFGYLNNAELTNEKFVNHYVLTPQNVLYRTGDFGRWSEDGILEYTGRRDEQVKIRGYRIELLEVEKHIEAYQDVKKGAVVSRELQSGVQELVAYVEGNENLNVSGLRSFLSDIIPTYMIPTHYVKIEKLPLTHSGKVDKKNLPLPDGLKLETGKNYYPPRNEFERRMVEVWQDVLERENIGIQDNFFDIGGHSLKAVQLVAAIQKRLKVEAGLRMIFDHPTIEGLIYKINKVSKMKDNLVTFNSVDSQSQNIVICIPSLLGESHEFEHIAKRFENENLRFAALDSKFFLQDDENKRIIEKYAESIDNFVGPNRTLNILGYSAGSKLGFEIIKLIEKNGFQVDNFIVLDSLPNIQPRYFDDKEIDQFLGAVINEMEGTARMLEKQKVPIKNSFSENPEFFNRVRNYFKFITTIKNDGKINSYIHVIVSEISRLQEADVVGSWKERTSQYVQVYQGFGTHYAMCLGEAAEKNSGIVYNILREVLQ